VSVPPEFYLYRFSYVENGMREMWSGGKDGGTKALTVSPAVVVEM